MDIPLPFFIESIGLFVAAKLLNVSLTLVAAPLVVLLAGITALYIPGLGGIVLGVVVYISTIKVLTKESDYLKIVGIMIVGFAIQKGMIHLLNNPSLQMLHLPPM